MGEGILALVANALGAVQGWLGFQSKKLDLKNAADMKDAQKKQDEVSAVDAAAKAIAQKNTDAIRKDLAE